MTEVAGSGRSRESLTASTFVELVDTLVDDFDVVDVLTVLASRCVELLDAAAAGILLVDEFGHLRVIGASNEQARLLELLQLQNEEGPCLDCYRTGSVVIAADLATNPPWPLFAAESVAAGLQSVCAVPLRLREQTLGCLNLFISSPRRMSDADIALARALADVATIAIIQNQTSRAAAIREGQLQHALDSRVVIEQAKGMISERTQVDLDAAFQRLRSHARANHRKLTDLAQEIVSGTFSIDDLA
jgi:GAF domain-containing protein